MGRTDSMSLSKARVILDIFEPLFSGLGATYAVRLRHVGKLVVDFLLVIDWTLFARCYG